MHTVKELSVKNNTHDYEWRFGKIRYTKKGTGTPVLLLHDLTEGSSIYEYHKLFDSAFNFGRELFFDSRKAVICFFLKSFTKLL